ncbi:hypothetical protein [Terrimonas alba]|uniref:hypothetical protein n=1 Tax=Terrimonas alba TaxID=3349636 RepID=UPI0035F23EBA
MKPVLYVGAALMIGASVYGFVDYKKASRSASFQKMYEEKKQTPVVTPAQQVKPDKQEETIAKKERTKPEASNKKTSAPLLKTRKATATKKIHYKEFSRAPLREDQEITPPAKSKD